MKYHLDMLVAAWDNLPPPSVEDCYPAMKPYYESLPAETQPGMTLLGRQ